MLIGMDLDEVLADFLSSVIKFHNTTYGTSLKREDFFSYNFWEVWSGTREEAIKKVYEFHKTHYFHEIQPVEGAVEGVRELKEEHELVVITSRQYGIEKETRVWVQKTFPDAFSGVYFTNDFSKDGLRSKSKKDFCKELGIDLLVEDHLNYAKECVADGVRVLLLDCPWNKRERPQKVSRVYSWKEIVERIQFISSFHSGARSPSLPQE
ncbi:hypothetical protein HY991_04155 [Candidatus Micrarchaeota archaeon]|nr:hypothetical protein [Candidatus Micrarchaeota archaeon]